MSPQDKVFKAKIFLSFAKEKGARVFGALGSRISSRVLAQAYGPEHRGTFTGLIRFMIYPFRELRKMVIFDFTILLRPFGGKICLWQTAASSGYKKASFFISLLLAVRDFALMSLNWINHETKSHKKCLSLLVFLLAGITIYNIYSIDSAFAADSSISLSLSSSTLSLDITPRTTTGDFAKSSSETVTVSSNHYSGYTLSIKANNTTNPTDLIGTTSSTNLLNSLSSDTTEADFSNPTESAGTSYNNKWGLNFAKNGTTSNVFHPSPSTTGTTIDTTSSSGNNTYNLAIGARASINTPFDSYTNTYVLAVVGNPTPYTITYNQNTEDEVTNMPSPNPETGSVSGNAKDISTTVPARDGYDFKGWCSVPTTGDTSGSNSDDTCSGTTYNPDGGGTALSLPLDQTGVNNITVYAIWEESTPTLYKAVANLVKKDTNNNPRTQSVEDLQAEITQPTSTDPSTDTSNSGVYKYDSSVFGESSDASNDHDIYYYRGILDTSGHTGSYGSDGEADAYPNYVKLLGSNICWRIVRTTGSGGVKMIYNGTWTSTTCARNQYDAQVTTQAFDKTANSSSKSIVGVGYTYNATYKSTTSDTQAGTLFGTNSNYTGNTTNSTIKNYIENTWYTSNMANYTNLLESSAGYCGDRSVNSGDSWKTYSDTTSITTPYTSGSSATPFRFGAYMRNQSTAQTPSLGCPRNVVDLYTTADATNGNKQLGKPASLLTADEASFAGSGSSTASHGSTYHAKSFLRSGSIFWLLSPYWRESHGYAGVSFLGSSLNYDTVHSLQGVRPVISLNDKTYIQGGSGTSTNPWVVADTPPLAIQDFTNEMCRDQASSSPVTVVDKRDGNDYTVRWINGNCWMTQNLRFFGSTLDPTTSNVASSTILDWGDLTLGNTYTAPRLHVSDNVEYGVYYNYAGVSAGTIASSSSDTIDIYNICPANWTLPTDSQQSGITGTDYTESFSPVYSGSYYGTYINSSYFIGLHGAGSGGAWWSSIAKDAYRRYYLGYSNNNLSVGDSDRFYYGFSARCVRK